MKQNQKEAVHTAIKNVLGKAFETGMNVAEIMTPEHRKQVNAILFEGFRAGSIQLDREFTDSDLKTYVSGLQSNWIRKDKRLNGNTKYIAKNPGSRAGSGDASLKAMRALLTTCTTDEERAEVQVHIDARVAEIASAKQAKVVDFSALPPELAKKFSK